MQERLSSLPPQLADAASSSAADGSVRAATAAASGAPSLSSGLAPGPLNGRGAAKPSAKTFLDVLGESVLHIHVSGWTVGYREFIK